MSATDVQPQQRFEFGRVVGQTFGLIGRNFGLFIFFGALFAALPNGAILFFQTWLLREGAMFANPNTVFWLTLGAGVVALVSAVVLQGAMTRVAVDDLSGRGASIGRAVSAGFGLMLPLIGLAILLALGQGLGFLLLIIPGLILMVRWVASAPALVTEQTGVLGAMGRSAELTSGHRWAIFGLLLLFGVLATLIEWIGGAVSATLVTGVFDFATMSLINSAVKVLINMIASMIGAAGAASIYIELRRVNEGAGVDELAKVFE